jgi:hypothetical protein
VVADGDSKTGSGRQRVEEQLHGVVGFPTRQSLPPYSSTARPILAAGLHACRSRLRPGPIPPFQAISVQGTAAIGSPTVLSAPSSGSTTCHVLAAGAHCLFESAPPWTGSSRPGTCHRCLRRLPCKIGRIPTKNVLFQVDLACRLPRRPEWHVAEVGAGVACGGGRSAENHLYPNRFKSWA